MVQSIFSYLIEIRRDLKFLNIPFKLFLFIVLPVVSFFLLTANASADQNISQYHDEFEHQPDYSANSRYIGPWKLSCEQKKFPNKSIARRFLNKDQFFLNYCEAKQTIYVDYNNGPLTAIMKLTPARIIFETQYIDQIKKNARLGIGPANKKVWYELYVNCYNSYDQSVCVLIPGGDWVEKAIVKNASKNNQAILSFVDRNNNKRLKLTFSLKYFNRVYGAVSSTYKRMKEILAAHPSYQASPASLGVSANEYSFPIE